MLGDAGGLFDAVKGIFYLVVSLYFSVVGDPMDMYLLKSLFVKNPLQKEKDKIHA